METKIGKKAYDFVGREGRRVFGVNYYLMVESPIGSLSFLIPAKGIEKKVLEKLVEEQDSK